MFLGETAYGVVTTFKGFGIRVKEEDLESVAHKIRPDDAGELLGDKWEVSGLPLSTGKESLIAFLHDWTITPLYTYNQGPSRTWVVRSTAPPTYNKLQHDLGLAVIKKAEPPRPKQPPVRERWTATKAATDARPAPPRSWSEVASVPMAAAVPVAPPVQRFVGGGSLVTGAGFANSVAPSSGQAALVSTGAGRASDPTALAGTAPAVPARVAVGASTPDPMTEMLQLMRDFKQEIKCLGNRMSAMERMNSLLPSESDVELNPVEGEEAPSTPVAGAGRNVRQRRDTT